MTGVGFILIIMQLFPAIGQDTPNQVIKVLQALPNAHINQHALYISISTIAIIYLFPKITKIVPSSLVALFVTTFAASAMQLDVPIISDIPSNLPAIRLDLFSVISLSSLTKLVIPALTLAAVACIESLLSAVVLANMTKSAHNSSRELVAQGVGNLCGALIGALPGAGATIRSVVNVKSGGNSWLSGIFCGLTLVTILVFGNRYASQIPLPTLAGILITIGISVIDYRSFRDLPHIPRSEAIVILTVIALTLFVSILEAVAVGITISCIMFMKKMSDIIEERSHISPLEQFKIEQPWDDELDFPVALEKYVYIKHLNGPLFFGFTNQFNAIIKRIPDINLVIIRMKMVPYMDQSGLYALEDVYLYLKSRNIELVLCELNQQPETMLRASTIIPGQIPEENVIPGFKDALKRASNLIAAAKTSTD